MPGPTTEAVNEDVKVLREDLHRVETAIVADVREVSTQVKGILSAIRILGALALTSLAASIWWGATLTANMASLEKRFDKLEASIGRAIEQGKARP